MMIKFVPYLVLLVWTVRGRAVQRRRAPCPPSCDPSRCLPGGPPPCYYGLARDPCGCCSACPASGEGEPCGAGTAEHCGDGLVCVDEAAGKACVCVSRGPVCGSDYRTYPSICRLRAENTRAELGGRPMAVLMQRGPCGPGTKHPESLSYKFNFIADVVDKVAPAVVHLELFISGSGFLISEDGWILTNAHVLANKQKIRVELRSGVHYDAVVMDADQKLDVALIKIKSEDPLPALQLGRSANLLPGEFVVAIGSPLALRNTVTMGIVSTTQRHGVELGLVDSNMEYIQTDAIINNGNSGGPLVNLDGDVIGINTLKVTAGISFAIPADKIRQFLMESYSRQMKGNTTKKKKYIGVRMLQLSNLMIRDLKGRQTHFPDDVTSGVYIYEVIAGAAAASAGVMNHDIIVGINGRSVKTTQDVTDAIATADTMTMRLRRGHLDI
ncbi:hypothetical protein NHX12_029365, partial [Muraenolepis orangiensis]